ncbi:transport secretion system IV protein, VirB7 [Rhizobium leguminosarum bv. phaseoli CCGM1]|nr:transport secretion system IV protein, VirB7 [Rhizobium leguminosarum bv. phaseoli CCGM1]
MSHPLPKCDGYSRRPLNRAMWQWQDSGGEQPATRGVPAEPTSHAASYVSEPSSGTPAAFGHFDVAGSYRPCEGE